MQWQSFHANACNVKKPDGTCWPTACATACALRLRSQSLPSCGRGRMHAHAARTAMHACVGGGAAATPPVRRMLPYDACAGINNKPPWLQAHKPALHHHHPAPPPLSFTAPSGRPGLAEAELAWDCNEEVAHACMQPRPMLWMRFLRAPGAATRAEHLQHAPCPLPIPVPV